MKKIRLLSEEIQAALVVASFLTAFALLAIIF